MVFHCVGCDIIKLQPLGVNQKRENKVPKFSVAHGPVVSPNCEHCNGRHTVWLCQIIFSVELLNKRTLGWRPYLDRHLIFQALP
jgi:hypothetical protein